MNSSSTLRISLKFIIIWILQIIVLKQVQFLPLGPYYYEAFVYPLFILLLPFGMHVNRLMLIAFFSGLLIDASYNTLGVHTASAVVLAFARPYILALVLPRGIDEAFTPSLGRLKFLPFLRYVIYAFLVYLPFYYTMVFFSHVFIVEIIVKSLLSFIVSVFFTLILAGILNGLD
jgi:hypothetical protein